jgi:TusA-related sulfurtransferase
LLLIDATQKNCKGVITELEKVRQAIDSGEKVETLVVGIPNRVDVCAWARRKGYVVERENRDGSTFRLTVSRR